MKKILYSGLYYDYAKPENDTSYEHRHIEAGFRRCATQGMFDVDYWHPDRENTMSADDLLASVGNYDAIFHVPFDDNFDFPRQVAILAMKMDIPVIQWDCDSSWRFHPWIMHRKDRATHFVTTHNSAVPWYREHGMRVIKSQWGGSPMYWCDRNAEKKYDVSFLGQKHGTRPEMVEYLIKSGIDVHLSGHYWDGWPNSIGHTYAFEDMMAVHHGSKICLNFSNPWHVGTLDQVKGRHFDICQAGEFQLATYADNLEEYFEFDKEIVVVNDYRELPEKIKYYLEHEDERLAIAQAGWERMQRDHQWNRRLTDIFTEVGIL